MDSRLRREGKRTSGRMAAAILAVAVLAIGCVIVINDSDYSSAETSGKCGDDLTWTFDEGTGALTITGTGPMYNYDFGMEHWGGNVIKTVSMTEGMTTVGDNAFQSCSSITSVTIPSTVTSIGFAAFQNLSIDSVTIPDSVTSIGEYAFANCNLTSVTIPDSMTTIEGSTFTFNPLKSVSISKNVKLIKKDAFKYADLNEVVVSMGCTVEEGAFDSIVIIHYRNLGKVNDPNTLEDDVPLLSGIGAVALLALIILGSHMFGRRD